MVENLESILKMEEFNNDTKDKFWNDLQEILTITYPNASYNCILQCAKRDLARNDSAIIVTGISIYLFKMSGLFDTNMVIYVSLLTDRTKCKMFVLFGKFKGSMNTFLCIRNG